jgi:hypothetical protein
MLIHMPAQDPDRPPFDIVRFETEAHARATELTTHVARLAVHAIDDSREGIQATGGTYTLGGGAEIALLHEQWYNDPAKTITKLRIRRAPLERVGEDNQRRKITFIRFVLYETFVDIDDSDPLISDPSEHEPWPSESMLDSAYRPSELIRAQTRINVERKLPQSPNYRTEKYSNDIPWRTRVVRLGAQLAAEAEKELATHNEYSPEEHANLIAQLTALDPGTAQHLELDFDAAWMEPSPTKHTWRPRNSP